MRATSRPGIRGILRFDPACWRCGSRTSQVVFHQTLLRYIGCNADTHLLAEARGDEITLRRELHHIDIGNRAEQNLL